MSLGRSRRSSSDSHSRGPSDSPRLTDSPRTPKSGDAIFSSLANEIKKYRELETSPEQLRCKDAIINLFAQLFERDTNGQYKLRDVAKDAIANNTLAIEDIQILITLLNQNQPLIFSRFSDISSENIQDFISRIEKTACPHQLECTLDENERLRSETNPAIFLSDALELLADMLDKNGGLTLEAVRGIEKIAGGTDVAHKFNVMKQRLIDLIKLVERPIGQTPRVEGSAAEPIHKKRPQLRKIDSVRNFSPLLLSSKRVSVVNSDGKSPDLKQKTTFSSSSPSLSTQAEKPLLEKSHSTPTQSTSRLDIEALVVQFKAELEKGFLTHALRLFAQMLDRNGKLTKEAIASIERAPFIAILTSLKPQSAHNTVEGMIAYFKKTLSTRILNIDHPGTPRLHRAESPRPDSSSPLLAIRESREGSPRIIDVPVRRMKITTAETKVTSSILNPTDSPVATVPAPAPTAPSLLLSSPSMASISTSSSDTWRSWSYNEDDPTDDTKPTSSLSRSPSDTTIVKGSRLSTGLVAKAADKAIASKQVDGKKKRLSVPKLDDPRLFSSSSDSKKTTTGSSHASSSSKSSPNVSPRTPKQ